jgi:hypothetical protein
MAINSAQALAFAACARRVSLLCYQIFIGHGILASMHSCVLHCSLAMCHSGTPALQLFLRLCAKKTMGYVFLVWSAALFRKARELAMKDHADSSGAV